MTGGIVVFAYSGIGHACLAALLQRGEAVRALFTHEDSAGETLWFASCAELARKHGVPVYTMSPGDGADMIRLIEPLRPALIFSFYYRHMIPMAVLRLAGRGAFNMHGSLLPRYRGRAPVNWAVLHGESETGVTLHHMIGRADAGDIVDQERVPIAADETAAEVMAKLEPAAVRLLLRQIDGLKDGTAPRNPQDESRATYFGGRKPEDGEIDWRQGATAIANLVRAVAPPYPCAFTWSGTRQVMIWQASAAAGAGAPGEVLSLEPLLVAAGEGAVRIGRYGFPGEDESGASAGVRAALTIGGRLGDRA